MAKKKGPTYTVGYGKPPKGTRFPPGVSGNPTGRPKGVLNVRTTLTRILSQPVVIVQNGKKKTVTKFEAAMTKMTHKAIEGDMRATSQVCQLMLSAEEAASIERPEVKSLGRSELALLKRLAARTNEVGDK